MISINQILYRSSGNLIFFDQNTYVLINKEENRLRSCIFSSVSCSKIQKHERSFFLMKGNPFQKHDNNISKVGSLIVEQSAFN